MTKRVYDQIDIVKDVMKGCGRDVQLIDIIGFDIYNHLRYPKTPPEMLLIGGDHCDGGQYGFIEHCPELQGIDIPFAYYCPADSDDGVCIMAKKTVDVVSMCLSKSYCAAKDNGETSRMAIIEKCIKAIKGRLVDYYGMRYAKGVDISCRLERDVSGYEYIWTPDNVGIYVRPDGIDKSVSHSVTYDYSMKKTYCEIGMRALSSKYWGTSLYYGKLLWWYENDLEIGKDIMLNAYDELGRHTLSQRLLNQ